MSRTRAVLVVGLLLTAWAGALHVRAAFAPPPGQVFAGTFHWIDDVYNYASYAQQAEDGRLLMRSKLVDPLRARAQLVNLEWWAVGRISRAIGRRPLLAFRLFAVLAAFALVAGAERWLTRAGVPASHRFAALWLVFLGGGVGGLLFEATDRPVSRCLDLSVAGFPYLEVLANPHFLAGTALLTWSLWCFTCVPSPRGPLLGVALGTALGLVRPYDLALLGLVRGASVVAARPRSAWGRDLAPLLGLLPVLAYDAWLFFGTDQFRSFQAGGAPPALVDFLPAFGPAVLLALASRRDPTVGEPAAREARVVLWTWATAGLALAVARPVPFALQFAVGVGVPLLTLGAAGLRRRPVAATVAFTLLLSSAVVVQTRIMMGDDPNWFVPRERMAAAEALRPRCRAGDRLLSPPDIGLFAIGLTACSAYVSHPAAADYERKLADVRTFYGAAAPADRRALLDRERITHVVLPGYAGPAAEAWLGTGAPFRLVPAPSNPQIAVYERSGPGRAASDPSARARPAAIATPSATARVASETQTPASAVTGR